MPCGLGYPVCLLSTTCATYRAPHLRLSRGSFLCGQESVTCGRHDLSLQAGRHVFHQDFFPGPSGLEQIQDHFIDDIAPKVTEREGACSQMLLSYLGSTGQLPH